ncbi:COG2984 ABC-type uncharacterized transport system, periplasmic component [Rhabdaerophilaceae bacterium]
MNANPVLKQLTQWLFGAPQRMIRPAPLQFPAWLVAVGVAFLALSAQTAPVLGQIGQIQPAPSSAAAADAQMTPRLRPDGKKWRIGYYEGGQFPDYEVIMKSTLRSLITLGWMEPMELQRANMPQAGAFWKYLSENAKSRFIEFPADAYFAAGDFDAEQRKVVRPQLISRLSKGQDIDLMIAMGTWAGQDLASADHSVATIVMSSSDPIGSKIVKSAEDSGFDHLHAKVEPTRYQRQVNLFHDVIGFKTLGVVYEDTPEGRTFGGVAAIEQVAKERGFTIVPCLAAFNNISRSEAEGNVLRCYDQLAAKVEAVYITVHRGVTDRSLPGIVASLSKGKVPSFSMLGSPQVQKGVLMSIAQADFSYVGRFHAETIARVFSGIRPRMLSQIWEDPAKIAINIQAAKAIGFNPPVELMLAADEIYETIEGAAKAP